MLAIVNPLPPATKKSVEEEYCEFPDGPVKEELTAQNEDEAIDEIVITDDDDIIDIQVKGALSLNNNSVNKLGKTIKASKEKRRKGSRGNSF